MTTPLTKEREAQIREFITGLKFNPEHSMFHNLLAALDQARAERDEARELVGYAEKKGYALREQEHSNDRRLLAQSWAENAVLRKALKKCEVNGWEIVRNSVPGHVNALGLQIVGICDVALREAAPSELLAAVREAIKTLGYCECEQPGGGPWLMREKALTRLKAVLGEK